MQPETFPFAGRLWSLSSPDLSPRHPQLSRPRQHGEGVVPHLAIYHLLPTSAPVSRVLSMPAEVEFYCTARDEDKEGREEFEMAYKRMFNGPLWRLMMMVVLMKPSGVGISWMGGWRKEDVHTWLVTTGAQWSDWQAHAQCMGGLKFPSRLRSIRYLHFGGWRSRNSKIWLPAVLG